MQSVVYISHALPLYSRPQSHLPLSAIYTMSFLAKLLRKPLLPPSSTLILITGATGHITSNIIREALNLKYHV